MKVNIKNFAVIFTGTTALLTSASFAGFTSSGCVYSVSSSAGSGSQTNTTVDLSPTAWMNSGGWVTAGSTASVTWANNVWGWNPSTNTGFMNANIVIRNNTGAAQDFVFTAAMNGTAAGNQTLASGSIGGQFVNGSGSLGQVTSSGPLWSALIDGSTVNSQLPNALFFAAPFQIISLGNFNFANIAVSNSIGSQTAIRFSLRISAGGEASFTSAFSFQTIPGPASIAILALTPLFGSRRRR
ncbi:MAG: hypothetical protein EXS17_04990 [Phycisphaerales bacterium]|nr:hypothetical protein [Phycisphaerales bacterium]